MADPKRHTVIEALKTRLQTITTGNGYYYDMDTRVDVWRVVPYLPAELPRINIMDEVDSLTDQKEGSEVQDWQLDVRIAVFVPITAILTLRKHIADIYLAIGADPYLNTNVIYVYPVSDSIELDQEEKAVASATLNFRIHYRHNKYTLA